MEEALRLITPEMRIAHINRFASNSISEAPSKNNNSVIIVTIIGFLLITGTVVYYEWKLKKIITQQ